MYDTHNHMRPVDHTSANTDSDTGTTSSAVPQSHQPPDPAPVTSGPDEAPRSERDVLLDELDEALVEVRRVLQRPGYRQRLLAGLPQDVPLSILRLLRVVQRASEPPSIGTVADVLAVDPSTASRMVDRAVARGELERRPCADDRRRARLHLTADGRALLETATARRRELLAEVTSDWSAPALDALVGQLERLQAGFDALEEPT